MFISNDDAAERLRDPRNALNQLDRSSSSEPLAIDLPRIIDPSIDIKDSVDKELNKIDKEQNRDPIKEAMRFSAREYARSAEFDPYAALTFMKQSAPVAAGRYPGIRNRKTPESASMAVASMILGVSATEQLFGSVPATQSLTKQGLLSYDDREKGRKPREALLEEIYTQGKQVVNKAFLRLNAALDILDENKIKNVTKATDLIKVATGLSNIIRSVTPKEAEPSEGNVHFHIMKPEQVESSQYETIEVGSGRTDEAEAINQSLSQR